MGAQELPDTTDTEGTPSLSASGKKQDVPCKTKADLMPNSLGKRKRV